MKFLIDTTFNFETTKGRVEVYLTAHLFQTRNKNNEHRYRSFMFQSRWQYEDIIKSAFELYNISEYSNKGKVALIFQYSGEEYGILLDIKKKNAGYSAYIITIDKLRDRHYSHGGMFARENNKIYTKYVLQESFLLEPKSRFDTVKDTQFFQTNFFAAKVKKYNHMDKIDFIRIFHSLHTRSMVQSIKTNSCFWIHVGLDKNEKCFLRVSVEELKIGESLKKVITMADFALNEEFVLDRARFKREEVVRISSSESANFGIAETTKPNNSGLKIKKKVNAK
ncbi:MAG: hypothetical protein PHE67_04270 [Campylobacterales bacterium]|nr:hypothetical protein [Campylobacterales bacterium]